MNEEDHISMGITRVLTDRDLREATINVEAITLVDMLRTLLDEADRQKVKLDIHTLRFASRRDEYMPYTTTYRLDGEAR